MTATELHSTGSKGLGKLGNPYLGANRGTTSRLIALQISLFATTPETVLTTTFLYLIHSTAVSLNGGLRPQETLYCIWKGGSVYYQIGIVYLPNLPRYPNSVPQKTKSRKVEKMLFTHLQPHESEKHPLGVIGKKCRGDGLSV